MPGPNDPVYETGAAYEAEGAELNPLVADLAFGSHVRRLVEHARDLMDTGPGPAAEKAWRYYQFKVDQDPLGARQTESGETVHEGSRVVESRVRDTINSLLPDIYRVFLSSHEIVEFEPRGPEDVEPAQQATDVISARFWRQNGASFLHDALLDWLIKFCAIRVYHEPVFREEVERFEGYQEAEVMALQQNPEVVELEAEPYEHPIVVPSEAMGGQPVQITALTCYRGLYRRQVLSRHEHKFCLVPQEELLLDIEAKSLDQARIVGTDSRRTVSEVVGLGLPYDVVRRHVTDGLDARTSSMLRMEREGDDGTIAFASALADTSTRYVRVVDVHVRLDHDDDGLAEVYHVLGLGDNATVVWAEEDSWPDYVISSPCPVPHQIIGDGVAELMLDRQEIATALARRFLDNLNQSLHVKSVGELRDEPDRDEVESLYGKHINVPAGTLDWFAPPFVGQYALQAMEYFTQTDVLRSGISPAGQGLDPSILKGQTVEGAKAIVGAPQSRTDFYVRLFAENVMAPLFKALLKMHVRFPNMNEVIRLRNTWVPVQPDAWAADYDASVRVGLGTGTKDEKFLALQILGAEIDKERALGSPLVKLESKFNLLSDIGALVGVKDPRRYFEEPTPELQAQAQEQAKAAQQEAAQMTVQAQAMVEQAKAAARGQTEAMLAQIKGDVEARLQAQEQAAKERQIILEAQQRQMLTALEARFEIELQRHRTPSGNANIPSQVQ